MNRRTLGALMILLGLAIILVSNLDSAGREEVLSQFGGGDSAAVNPDEEEVRRPRIDDKPRDRPDLRGKLPAPRAHESARFFLVFPVAEGCRAHGLSEGVDRPGGR